MSQTFDNLINSNSGKDMLNVIENLLESNILNISKYLQNSNILGIKESSPKHYNSLVLFSSGDFMQYKNNQNSYITLSNKMLWKLKMLTFIKIASRTKLFNIDSLQELLDIKSELEMNKLFYDISSEKWAKIKVNIQNNSVKILEVKPRDNVDDLDDVLLKLNKWLGKIENVEIFLKNESTNLSSL